MAVNIPIWPGSSSFYPGNTPFGFYDNDYEFQIESDKVAKWCAQRLGYPLSDVELQDIHFYTAFEEAITEYSNQVNQFNIIDNMLILQGTTSTSVNLTGRNVQPTLGKLIGLSKMYGTEAGSGGFVKYKRGYINVTGSVQTYDLSTSMVFEDASDSFSNIEIRKVFHETPSALVRYFDPFVGTGLGSQQMLEQFGWGSYSPGVSFMLMPMYADLLRLQSIEFNDTIRRSAYSFQITNNRFKVFPTPPSDTKLYIDYISTTDRNNIISSANTGSVSDFSNAPYELHKYEDINIAGRTWIYKYTLALTKEVLGNIRSKYSTIPIPGSELTLNGTDLVAQATAEREALITQLRENLDAVSREKQLAKQQAEAESMQSQLNKIPLPIYIG